MQKLTNKLKTKTREEWLKLATLHREGALRAAESLGVDPDELFSPNDDGELSREPNSEVRQWAQDLASDMNDWQAALDAIALIDAAAAKAKAA